MIRDCFSTDDLPFAHRGAASDRRRPEDGIRRTRRASQDSDARFRAISDASPLGIFVSDASGECVYTNAAYQKISGLTFDQALGTRWSQAIHPEDRHRVLSDWLDSVRSESPFQTEARFLRNDGSVVWTRLHAAVVRDGKNSDGRVQIIEDLTEHKSHELARRASEKALVKEKERAQLTLESIGAAVLSTDLAGKLVFMNAAAEMITGWSGQEASGRPMEEVLHIVNGTNGRVVMNPARRAIRENRVVGLESNCVLIRRDGFELAIEDSSAPIHDRVGRVIGAVIVFHDVSTARALAFKMKHVAQHDLLTGLANRVLLNERLSLAIGLATRHDKQIALLFLDVDFFKRINDSLGHAAGDSLLKSVAERLSAHVRATDTVCRLGGDEFVILLSEIEHRQDAVLIAEKLLADFVHPLPVHDMRLQVGVSIGISIFPEDGSDADTLMRNADTAMYWAKLGGRGSYRIFKTAAIESAPLRLISDSR